MTDISDKTETKETFFSKLITSFRALKQIRNVLRLNDLPAQTAQMKTEIERLKAMTDGLKKRVDNEWGTPENTESFDDFYYYFEEFFRGSRDAIKNKLKVYLPYLERVKHIHAENGFLDVGCGRGEWLELLRDNGVIARGIDMNGRMVRETQEKGLKTEKADVLEYLRRLPNDTLLGLSAFHVVEHLSFTMLMSFLREARRVIVPGGLMILETPNPENLMVGSANFYVDPTHRHPILPPAMAFMLSHAGFVDHECIRLSIPEYPGNDAYDVDHIDEAVKNSGVGPFNPEIIKVLVKSMNAGYDYALITYKPLN